MPKMYTIRPGRKGRATVLTKHGKKWTTNFSGKSSTAKIVGRSLKRAGFDYTPRLGRTKLRNVEMPAKGGNIYAEFRKSVLKKR